MHSHKTERRQFSDTPKGRIRRSERRNVRAAKFAWQEG